MAPTTITDLDHWSIELGDHTHHFVHTLRLRLRAQGIDDSWQTLRETLATQRQ